MGMTLVSGALPPLQNSKKPLSDGTWGSESFATVDLNFCLSLKRYEIGPWLLWIIGSHVADRSMSVPMTLKS